MDLNLRGKTALDKSAYKGIDRASAEAMAKEDMKVKLI
jgi:hypothetical protein